MTEIEKQQADEKVESEVQPEITAVPTIKIRKRKLGDRWNGYKVRSLPPMQYVTSYVMKDRNDASNYFRSRIEMTQINKYIRYKAKEENMPGFGFMHILAAAFVRVLCTYPGLNRFISGQKIYHRHEILLSMIVKKDFSANAQGTSIRPVFKETDTIYDVYKKMQAEIDVASQAGDSNAMDNVARAVTKLPSLLLRGFVGLMKCLDYFGIMPKLIYRASPFHGSMFISNLGSLGIPPIYHHLYNFGDMPIFLTFGGIYRENFVKDDGTVEVRKYIDYTVVSDERITDGSYYAAAMKLWYRLLCHPWELDKPPAEIIPDVD